MFKFGDNEVQGKKASTKNMLNSQLSSSYLNSAKCLIAIIVWEITLLDQVQLYCGCVQIFEIWQI